MKNTIQMHHYTIIEHEYRSNYRTNTSILDCCRNKERLGT